mmetsp:Transcript_21848/g.39269  ORF Transcript_21848/g.39269 Transcript_21848/m.39269 type:complete len:355 (-) Transcript_21848:380-1444(-)
MEEAGGQPLGTQILDVMQRELQIPFPLDRPPLLRAVLLHGPAPPPGPLPPAEWGLVVVASHCILDGKSCAVLVRELTKIYTLAAGGQAEEPLPPLQYTDFAAFHMERPGNPAKQLQFWRQRLQDRPPIPLALAPHTEYMRLIHNVPQAEVLAWEQRWQALAPLYTLVLSTFFLELRRDWDTFDLTVGSPVTWRATPPTMAMLGPNVNKVVLRLLLSDTWTFDTLVTRVHVAAQEAKANIDVPHEQLLEALNPPGKPPLPLHQAWYTHMAAEPLEHPDTVTFQPTAGLARCFAANGLLQLTSYHHHREQGGLCLSLAYPVDVYSTERAKAFLARMVQTLGRVVPGAQQPLGTLCN